MGWIERDFGGVEFRGGPPPPIGLSESWDCCRGEAEGWKWVERPAHQMQNWLFIAAVGSNYRQIINTSSYKRSR